MSPDHLPIKKQDQKNQYQQKTHLSSVVAEMIPQQSGEMEQHEGGNVQPGGNDVS